jgi:MYXO-CTERM domain-containing protein
MKGLRKQFASQIWFAKGTCFVLALTALFVKSQAKAVIYTLTDQNSSTTLNLGSSAGMTAWTVDAVNQVNQQWFWYRIGPSGPQFDLSALDATPYITTLGSKQLTAVYTNASYGVQVTYTLTGQSAGSGRSGLTESVRSYNFTGSPLDFHLFMYSDFMVGGPSQLANQHVAVGTDGNGDSTSVQTFGSPAVGSNSVALMLAASRTEVSPYNNTLNELTTLNGVSLNNSTTGGPGHITWAFEWDLAINASTSTAISITDSLVVPEPSSGVLALLGLGFLAVLRRQRHSV